MAIKPSDSTIPPMNDGKSNRRHGTGSGFGVVVLGATVVVGASVVVMVVVVGGGMVVLVVVLVVVGDEVVSGVVVFVDGATVVVVVLVVGVVVSVPGARVVGTSGTFVGAGGTSATVPFLPSSFAAKAKCPFATKNAITITQIVWYFIFNRFVCFFLSLL